MMRLFVFGAMEFWPTVKAEARLKGVASSILFARALILILQRRVEFDLPHAGDVVRGLGDDESEVFCFHRCEGCGPGRVAVFLDRREDLLPGLSVVILDLKMADGREDSGAVVPA